MSSTSRNGRKRWLRGAAVLVVAAVALPAIAWTALWTWATVCWDRALDRATEIAWVEADVSAVESGATHVRLTAGEGLSVRGRLRERSSEEEPADTAFLLLGGVRTGDRAAELFDPPRRSVVLACDYPLFDRLPSDDVLAKIRSLPGLVEGAAQSLPAFAVAVHWLAQRPGIRRVIVVGVSLGTPYAAALARDPSVDGVALLYGGGDVRRIVERALPVDPPVVRRALASALGGLIAPLDPVRHIGRRPELPVLLVSAERDRRIPAESVRALREAAPAGARHVSVPGDHVRPDETALVARAVEEVVRWAAESVSVSISGDGS